MIDRRTRDKLHSTVTTVDCYNYTPLGIIFNYSLDTYDSGVSERIGESGNSAVVEFRCSDAVDSTGWLLGAGCRGFGLESRVTLGWFGDTVF
jgi:hypothetical protein